MGQRKHPRTNFSAEIDDRLLVSLDVLGMLRIHFADVDSRNVNVPGRKPRKGKLQLRGEWFRELPR